MLKQKFSKIAFLKIFSVKIKVFLLLTLPILAVLNCNTTDPKLEPDLKLELKDVSCTEAWLQLTTNNTQLPATINLLKNNSVTQTFSLSTQDSLLYIDSLLPNQNYYFQVSSIQHPASSNKVNVTTLDTTSHNFTWQTFEFGQHSSSLLYDVAIIDENNIWAVGEIYMNDSLGNPDPTFYNAMHWDGNTWELKKILYQGGIWTIKTIYAFNENDIWFSGYMRYLNGNFIALPIPDILMGWGINKIWGSNSNDLYIVGNDGNIAHYGGSSLGWAKIESGTTTNINDAWGFFENGTSTVYCPVSSVFNPPQDKKILRIINGKVDSVGWGMNRIIYSCWSNSINFLYVGGEGVFVNKFGTWEQITLPAITTNSIRGNDINDVFAVGSMGTIFHFNGINWQVISSYTQKENYRVDFKNNVVAVCGYYNGKGFVEIGKRN